MAAWLIPVELVRPAEDADLLAIAEIYDHYVLTSHATFDLEPVAPDRRREWFVEHAGGRHRAVVAVDEGQVIGFASSGQYRPRTAYETTVETCVYVAPGSVGRGIGSVLYRVLIEALEGEDVHRALAGIALPNDASVSLHERFRFHRVAHFSEQGRKFGRFWDVDWYEARVRSYSLGWSGSIRREARDEEAARDHVPESRRGYAGPGRTRGGPGGRVPAWRVDRAALG